MKIKLLVCGAASPSHASVFDSHIFVLCALCALRCAYLLMIFPQTHAQRTLEGKWIGRIENTLRTEGRIENSAFPLPLCTPYLCV